ncbi:unnamed protein product [Cuscuta europaea]|uniref:Uncharacterized protein n=2 Tax=Cuscuta europaea TaxID=41803 RepID=A0A9P1DX31_CUSEU|nr:unnamed protein product [Cuscuta europaea]
MEGPSSIVECTDLKEREVISKRKRPARNDDIGNDSYDKVISIFNYIGRCKGAATYCYIVGGEMKIAHTYILMNCPEILPFYNEFRASLSAFPDDAMVDSDFALWYQQPIRYRGINDPLLVSLSWGPFFYAKVWHSSLINDYTYHTVEYGEGRPTMNSGLCVPTIGSDNSETIFFGFLHEILELQMPSGLQELTCVLFRCTWGDPTRGVRKNSKYII